VSPHVIRYDAELGEKRPAHCTAMGQILLADLPEGQLDAYLRHRRFPRLTPRTLTTRAALTRKLEQIRRVGAAVNIEERVPGASAVGAAIRAGAGRAIAGIIVAGPTRRIAACREALVGEVKAAALRISQTLQAELPPATSNGAAEGHARRGRPAMVARGGLVRSRG
jgi:DNA-binding IclR family transcriptional regulator